MYSISKTSYGVWSRLLVMMSVLFVVLLTSCSKNFSPFTQQLHKEQKWSDEELKSIQFYLSEDIVLRREIRSGDSRIREGKIKIINGKKIEEIVFEECTPGVFMFSPQKGHFAVSFEGGGESRYLMFGPNPKASGRYVLLAKDWSRKKGKVTYDGKTYTTTSTSAFAGLEVDMKRFRSAQVKSRKAKGRTVD